MTIPIKRKNCKIKQSQTINMNLKIHLIIKNKISYTYIYKKLILKMKQILQMINIHLKLHLIIKNSYNCKKMILKMKLILKFNNLNKF